MIGHITMWNLYHAYHYNVWLDIKPSHGHRVLMQTYPGGVMSGLDYYMNDRGMIVCETTLAQTRFDAAGIPLVDRIRRATSVFRLNRPLSRNPQTRKQRAVHQRMAPRRYEDQRGRHVRARHAQISALAAAVRTNGSKERPVSTGAATTRKTCP